MPLFADLVSEDSRFFLKSEWGPASEYWPALSFSKRSVGDRLRQEYRPASDFVIYAGTSNPENTEDPNHRRRLLSAVKIEPNQLRKTWELIPQQSWDDAQVDHAGRWPYSYAILKAWGIHGLPLASSVVPNAYRQLGLRPNWGGVVEVGPEERGALLQLNLSRVELKLQPSGRRAAATRKFVDAPRAVKEEVYRMAQLITDRKERSGTASIRWNPMRQAAPSSSLQELLFSKLDEQSGRCGLCHKLIPIPTDKQLLKCSPDRIDSSNPSYDRDNVQITHLACNWAKNDATHDDFEEWLEFVTGNVGTGS